MTRDTEYHEYEAQGIYADMLFKMLEIPNWQFLKKWKALRAAQKYRDSHKKCCEWANEED